MKIKDLSKDERPREKLISRGEAALSNAELIAILLRSGSRNKNALEVAQQLLADCGGSLTKASSMSIEKLCSFEGIGESKAVGIAAALALGKRLFAERPDMDKRQIRSASDVYAELQPEMRGLKHEECWILYLARNNKLLSKERLSMGGLSETIIEVKTIARRALETFASGVIITHNHPSGDPRPGAADIRMTQAVKRALDTFSIELLDHVVIADGSYYSFSDESVCFA